jgi:hypothetical protein
VRLSFGALGVFIFGGWAFAAFGFAGFFVFIEIP